MCEPANQIDPGVEYTYSNTIPIFDASTVDVKVGYNFRFKPFIAGTGIVIDETTNAGAITITATGATLGYTFSTLPGGTATLVGTLVANDFQFRGLRNGAGIVFNNSNPNFLEIAAVLYTYSSYNVMQANFPIIGTMLGTDFRFKPLIAGTGIGIDATTVPNALIISNTAQSDTFSTAPNAQVVATTVVNKVGNNFVFRGFIPGTNISIVESPTGITFSSAQYTYSDTTGVGASLRGTQVGTNFAFKTLVGSGIVTVDGSNPNTITISAPVPLVYTYSDTLLTGVSIRDTQVGGDFRFRRLIAGNNITLTAASGSVTIDAANAPTYTYSDVTATGITIRGTQVGTDFSFRRLFAGTNITLSESLNPGGVTISASGGLTYTYSDVNPAVGVTIRGTQIGTDFQFKRLVAGTNVSFATTADSVTINAANAPVYTYSDAAVGGVTIRGTQVGTDFSFRQLFAGTNITINGSIIPGGVQINSTPYTFSDASVAGISIREALVGNDFQFRRLVAGANITLTNAAGAITIAANILTYTYSDLTATGTSIRGTLVGTDFRFKTLFAGTNVSFDEITTPGVIRINVANPPLYTFSDASAAGLSIREAQVGTDFQFRRLVAGSNITLTNASGAITIDAANAPAYTYSDAGPTGATIRGGQVGTDFSFKRLVAGTGVTLTEAPTTVTINSTGSSTATIFQNNTLFVDQQYGNNATAQREVLTLPYQTISAAVSAAIAGDLIYVLPGTYNGVNISTSINLNYYFADGTTINGSTGVPIFNINGGTISVSGSGVFNNNIFLTTNGGNFSAEFKTVTGSITMGAGTLSMKGLSYTGNLNSSAITALTMIVDNMTSVSPGPMFNISSNASVKIISSTITCDGFMIMNANNWQVDINVGSLVSTTQNQNIFNLFDSSSGTTPSTCYCQLIADTISTNSGTVAALTSGKSASTTNIYPSLKILANNISVSIQNGGSASMFISSSANVIIESAKLTYTGTGTYIMYNAVNDNSYINANIGSITPIGTTNMTIYSNGLNCITRSDLARINGSISGGVHNFGTLFLDTAGAIETISSSDITLSANTFQSVGTHTNQLFRNQANNRTMNIKLGTANITAGTLNVILVNTGSDTYFTVDKLTVTSTGTAVVNTITTSNLYFKADSVSGDFNFVGQGSVYVDINKWRPTSTIPLFNVSGVLVANIGDVAISTNQFHTGTNQNTITVDTMTVSGTATTPLINVTNNGTVIRIKKLINSSTIRSLITSVADVDVSIDNLNSSSTNTTNYLFSAFSTGYSNYNFGSVDLTGANGLFFIRTPNGNGAVTVNIAALTSNWSNTSQLFVNNANSGSLAVTIDYGRISSEALRCTQSGHTTYFYATRLESIGTVDLITNTSSGTLEFGGNLKVANGSILRNSSPGLNANILPSKFVSSANCIISTLLTTMYFAPTVTRNGVSILQVTVVPVGNLTVAPGMN